MGKRLLAVVLLLVVLGGAAGLVYWFRIHGFSAREQPSWFEKMLARHARRIATPAGAREMPNPYPLTEATLPEAREHWVAHCSTCHALDGRGDSTIGRNLYPKAPDMTDAETQRLSDGELFYIISNGVRFTGMPAWGAEDSPESIWALVGFIRRLPNLSPDELKLMQEMVASSSSEEKPGAPKPHTDAPGAQPHKH